MKRKIFVKKLCVDCFADITGQRKKRCEVCHPANIKAIARKATAKYLQRTSSGETYRETREGGVDKKCLDCPKIMKNVFAKRARCPTCAEKHRVNNNAKACVKYREKVERERLDRQPGKNLSYERWYKSHKEKEAEKKGAGMPEIDFTGLPVPTKFDNLFCSIK